MRNIYDIGSHLTQIILILGIVLIVIGGLFAYGGNYSAGVSLIGTGVMLALSSFALSLLVYLGMDVYAIRQSLAPEPESETAAEVNEEPEPEA